MKSLAPGPEPRTAKPETQSPKPPAAAKAAAGEVCPVCGGETRSQHCKVFCTKCGHLVYSCSEF